MRDFSEYTAPGAQTQFLTYCNVHLVSDSTGETVTSVMRATVAQFDQVVLIEHPHYLVRSQQKLDQVIREIEGAPGLVFYTLSKMEHRAWLELQCGARGIMCVAVLDPALDAMSRYLGLELNRRVGGSRILNAEYFQRIDALDFAMDHDDGQQPVHLLNADVIILGVSRTSKTPTSVYLAHRGVKAANVPIVPGVELPKEVFETDALVVGLTISPERLVHIRRNRLAAMKETRAGDYTEEQAIRSEISNALRLYERHNLPVIDVSRRSIEETAAAVLNLLSEKEGE